MACIMIKDKDADLYVDSGDVTSFDNEMLDNVIVLLILEAGRQKKEGNQ